MEELWEEIKVVEVGREGGGGSWICEGGGGVGGEDEDRGEFGG